MTVLDLLLESLHLLSKRTGEKSHLLREVLIEVTCRCPAVRRQGEGSKNQLLFQKKFVRDTTAVIVVPALLGAGLQIKGIILEK